MKKGRQDRIPETLTTVKDVKEVFSLNESRKKTDKLRLISM